MWKQFNSHRVFLVYKHGRRFIVLYTNMAAVSLVPRRFLLPRYPSEVWERAGEYLLVTSQLTVESRIDQAENA